MSPFLSCFVFLFCFFFNFFFCVFLNAMFRGQPPACLVEYVALVNPKVRGICTPWRHADFILIFNGLMKIEVHDCQLFRLNRKLEPGVRIIVHYELLRQSVLFDLTWSQEIRF